MESRPTREDEIKSVIKERFKNKFPSTDAKFKEWIPAFVCWVVDETIKEFKI